MKKIFSLLLLILCNNDDQSYFFYDYLKQGWLYMQTLINIIR